jgi:hypothetical protein
LVCARAEDVKEGARAEGVLTIRDEDGAWTDAYMAFRREMGGMDFVR